MAWYNTILTYSITALQYVWTEFIYWISIFFVIPFQEPEILWILIPIWITLIFTDFFQEKHGTQLGNAITNGAIMIWVGIDWFRYILRDLTSKELLGGIHFAEFGVCFLVMTIGAIIIIGGVHKKKYIKYIGRVRETSYLMLVFSPVIYNIVEIDWHYFLVSLLFFPVFYFFFELVDIFLPSPLDEDEEKNKSTLDNDLDNDGEKNSEMDSIDDNINMEDNGKDSESLLDKNPEDDSNKSFEELEKQASQLDEINNSETERRNNKQQQDIMQEEKNNQLQNNNSSMNYNYKSAGGNGKYEDQEEDDFF